MTSKPIVVSVTPKVHEDLVAHVKKKGFNSVAAYIRILIRADLDLEKARKK